MYICIYIYILIYIYIYILKYIYKFLSLYAYMYRKGETKERVCVRERKAEKLCVGERDRERERETAGRRESRRRWAPPPHAPAAVEAACSYISECAPVRHLLGYLAHKKSLSPRTLH